jgi:type VI secretion system protein ImpG
MNSELLPYYERELIFLKKTTAEFAAQYPGRASALELTRNGSDDPHVERILEGFALIAGRIQRKIDEEFPEITQSLLDLLYPHLLRPVPPITVLQFEADPELSKTPTGHFLPRGTTVYSAPMNGVQVRFRTGYDVRLWPIEVASAEFGEASNLGASARGARARYVLRIRIKPLGGSKLSSLKISTLRFRIGGDVQAAHWLYEALFTKVSGISIRTQRSDGLKQELAELPPSSLNTVGFGRNESILPMSDTSFQGYRLLQEYFCYPQKFLFFDLAGLERISTSSILDELEVLISIDGVEQRDRALLLESSVNAETFQLGCTPAINLFEHSCDPIRLTHTKSEYEVTPDVHSWQGFEVYSIDKVHGVSIGNEASRKYRPFYSFRHGSEDEPEESPEAFWFLARRPSARKGDFGSDVYLSLVDRTFNPKVPALEAISVRATCSNRDLVGRLRLVGVWGELDLENETAVRVRVVHGPTDTVRPDLRGELQWRLISHLSLNHLSLVEGGVDGLQEILRLYDTTGSKVSSRQISGISSVRSGRKVARLDSDHGVVLASGVTIDLELDEEKFSGGGAYLLASILDHFLGLYCAVNSFTQLRVRTQERKGVVWQWPLRSGEQVVV